jgi:repressor LexA
VIVPILGTIAAGTPIPVPNSDNWTTPANETIELPQDMIGIKQVFALRVKGQSMIDALIDDGDIVLMETADSAENGEMVAVWLKDREEVTLKKIYVESDRVLLKPANQSLKPMQQNPDNVEIQGKVIGVIRKL